jgi:hypothetical protein
VVRTRYPSRFDEFRRRYIEELRRERGRLTELRRRARSGTLTIVYSARDTEHNDAVVLAEVLRCGLPKGRKARATLPAVSSKRTWNRGRASTSKPQAGA